MKQIEPKQVTIDDITYAVYPFDAMYAANLSGELGRFLGPIVSGMLPLLGTDDDLLTMDLSEAMPMLVSAFETLDGDRVERLLKKLLTDRKNISCEYRDETTGKIEQHILSLDLLNQIFCQNIGCMYMLAVEVIKVNYSGFFEKLLGQSGNLQEIIKAKMSGSTGSLMAAAFPS